MTAGKIRALLDGRFNVSIDDIRAVALPALRHRVILNFEGEAEGITPEAIVRSILDASRRRPSSSRRVPRRPPRPAATAAAPPPGSAVRPPRRKPAFLPSEIDPTVFDEGFLRQLERLQLIMKAPVRGGLKGGRRSVKRGQSVEFADFRDYALGDDLRQLDWNVLRAPREAVHQAVRRGGGRHDPLPPRRVGVDGGRPARRSSCSRSARRRRWATSGWRRRTGSPSRRSPRGRAGGRSRCAAPGASSGCSRPCRRSTPRTARRTSLASARHAGGAAHGPRRDRPPLRPPGSRRRTRSSASSPRRARS